MRPEIVAAALLELVEDIRCPVGFPGRVVDLVGVVEERAQTSKTVPLEGAIERQQVLPDRVRREMIDDVTFAAGGGALHELAVPCCENGMERPAAGRCRPVQAAARLKVRSQVQGVAGVGIGHQHRQGQLTGILHLLECQCLKIPVS
jgi:hypothetical protein